MKKIILRNMGFSLAIFIGLAHSVQAGEKEAWQALDKGDYKTAYQEFLLLAKDGNLVAQHYIGMMYHNGYGVALDYSQAAFWFGKVADNPGNNIGNPSHLDDPQKAVLQLKQYAHEMLCHIYGENDQGPERSTYDLNKAALHCTEAADQAHFPEVRFQVGKMYQLGQGVAQNDAKAFYWYNRSIEEDRYPKSFGNLAYLYLHGKGVSKNVDKAAEWALRGAQLNDTYSQILISGFYLQGIGINQNYQKSFFWANIVLLHGNLNDALQSQVRTLREQALSHLTPEELPALQKQIFDWQPSSVTK